MAWRLYAPETNTSMFRRHSSSHRRCRILRSNLARKRASPTAVWRRIHTHPQRPTQKNKKNEKKKRKTWGKTPQSINQPTNQWLLNQSIEQPTNDSSIKQSSEPIARIRAKAFMRGPISSRLHTLKKRPLFSVTIQNLREEMKRRKSFNLICNANRSNSTPEWKRQVWPVPDRKSILSPPRTEWESFS